MAILFQNSRSLSGRERGLCLEEKAPKTQASAGSQMRRNVIWNIIGSLCMAASTVVLMSAAGRIGEAEGALFAAAFTMAQQLAVIGYFEVRAIQVTDVAEFVGFTRSYFCASFKKKTGMTPQEYLIQTRIARAKQLLANPDLRIMDIAPQVGYDDPLHFSKAFHRCCGMSPKEYRNQLISDT